MAYTAEYSEVFFKRLKKLKSKNGMQYEAILKKISEILQEPETYKPLRYDLKDFRRVHVLKSFVMLFKIDNQNRIVRFEDFGHHDKIYERR